MTYPKLSALAMPAQPHQDDISDRLADDSVDGQLAYHGLGSGKTMTALNAADRQGLPLLAVVPASLRPNMHKEIAKMQFTHPAHVVSYHEALKKLRDPEFMDRAANSLVAIDEGHLTAGQDSMRRDLLKFLPSKKKLIMTGTPIRNHPSEVSPIINSIKPGALPEDKRLFESTFMTEGADGIKRPKNLRQFADAVHGTTHHYSPSRADHFPSMSESIVEVPMSDKQQAAYNFVVGKYPTIAYKMRHGLPADMDSDTDFAAFLTGPRQVVNHPGKYMSDATDLDAHKIQTAADEIAKRYRSDKNYRGVGYSAYLEAGVAPLSRALTERGIPHAFFTGEQADDERKKSVEDYNAGKVPVLLISGAGSAGLDLKGTKHIAVMEPHWNEELIKQVMGRGVRYKSHSHLPEEERHVEIQRFHSVHQPSWWDKLWGRRRSSEQTADEYLYNMAKAKQYQNEPFLRVLRGEDPDAVESEYKTASVTEQYMLRKAVLFDIDDTLVTECAGKTIVLPGRKEKLLQLKAAGYALIAVTNRACWETGQSLIDLYSGVEEVDYLLDHLLEDVVFCPTPDEQIHKPAPTMLNWAITQYHLDPLNTCYVGNCIDDFMAAEAAGIPAYRMDDFFAAPGVSFPSTVDRACPMVHDSDYGWKQEDSSYVGTLPVHDQDEAAELLRRLASEIHGTDIDMQVKTNGSVLRVQTKEAAVAAWVDQMYSSTFPVAKYGWTVVYAS